MTQTEPSTTEGGSAWQRVRIDGVTIDAVSEPQVVEHVMDSLEHGDGGLIITANSDILRQLRRRDGRWLAPSAALVVPDGMPLIWASRLQGAHLPQRVTGVDLLWSLSNAAATHSRTVYLLGAAPGVAERAAHALRAVSPGLQICGWSSPAPGFEADAAAWALLVAEVTSRKPDLVFVALGFPKQERVALRLLEHLPTTWFVGCGGSLDMAADHTLRAPAALQAVGAEWAFRLYREPRRLMWRYLVSDAPYVVCMLIRARIARSRRVRTPRFRLGAGR